MRMPAADVIAILEEAQAAPDAARASSAGTLDGGMDVVCPASPASPASPHTPIAPGAPTAPRPTDLDPVALGQDGAFFEEMPYEARTRELLEDVVSEAPAARYVVFHPDLGILIDIQDNRSYWTFRHDAGNVAVGVFLDPDTPDEIFSRPNSLPGYDIDRIEIFQVDSGHWSDLLAVGLPAENLRFNDIALSRRTHLTTLHRH